MRRQTKRKDISNQKARSHPLGKGGPTSDQEEWEKNDEDEGERKETGGGSMLLPFLEPDIAEFLDTPACDQNILVEKKG